MAFRPLYPLLAVLTLSDALVDYETSLEILCLFAAADGTGYPQRCLHRPATELGSHLEMQGSRDVLAVTEGAGLIVFRDGHRMIFLGLV